MDNDQRSEEKLPEKKENSFKGIRRVIGLSQLEKGVVLTDKGIRIIKLIAIFILLGGIVMLFVSPLTMEYKKSGKGELIAFIIASSFFYLIIWGLIIEILWYVSSVLYGLRYRTLFLRPLIIAGVIARFPDFPREVAGMVAYMVESNIRVTKRAAVIACFISYLFTVYGFALVYVTLFRIDPNSFNVDNFSIFTSFYFSTTTAATVGFGDIAPRSIIARSFVMLEVYVSIIYVVFLFSLLATALQANETDV